MLTPRREKFVAAYLELGDATKAYRRVYNVGDKVLPKSIWERASRMLNNDKVQARLAELRAELAQRNMVTIESLIAELEEARTVALTAETPQSGAAVAASLGKAKLLGLGSETIKATVTHRELPASIDDLV